MPILIDSPSVIQAAGTQPKHIQEFAGRVNSGHDRVSVARMVLPRGWREPGQRPEFEEITVVLRGMLRVEHTGGQLDVAGERPDLRVGRDVEDLPHEHEVIGYWGRAVRPRPPRARRRRCHDPNSVRMAWRAPLSSARSREKQNRM